MESISAYDRELRRPATANTTLVDMLARQMKAADGKCKIFVIDVGQTYHDFASQVGATIVGSPLVELNPFQLPIARVDLDWFERALFETSAEPRGGFKQAWTMKLLRTGFRCQLPRGFLKGGKPVFVGGSARQQREKPARNG